MESKTYLDVKNCKSKKKYQTYKTFTSKLESVNTVAILSSTATSVTLSVTSFVQIMVPFSAAIGCSLSIANKVIYKIILN